MTPGDPPVWGLPDYSLGQVGGTVHVGSASPGASARRPSRGRSGARFSSRLVMVLLVVGGLVALLDLGLLASWLPH